MTYLTKEAEQQVLTTLKYIWDNYAATIPMEKAIATMQAVIDATEQEAVRDLHDKIMNIPVSPGYGELNINQRLAYKIGHKDARHAAAELALSAPPAPQIPEQSLQQIAEFGELQNQVAQVREMSDEQIGKWWAADNGLEDCDMCKLADFVKVVRAVESAVARGGS